MRPGRRLAGRDDRLAGAGLALAGWIVTALLVSCGGATTARPMAESQARRQEITALWAQIRDWRREAGMGVEPDDSAVMAMSRMSVSSAAQACQLPPSPRAGCTDVCGLGDAICDNAESICSIADELGNDAWAREKCDSAKASCREAQERCCRCDHEPPETEPAP
jgi:hypothetical protein